MAEDESKGIYIFGSDITKIPCFRNSYLYGISGGIGAGLIFFLFTSRAKAATHFGVASFAVVTLSYWTHCRYNYSKTKFEMEKLKKGIQEHILHEGTALGEAVKNAKDV